MQKCHVSPEERHVRLHPTRPASAFQSGHLGLAESPGVKEPGARYSHRLSSSTLRERRNSGVQDLAIPP